MMSKIRSCKLKSLFVLVFSLLMFFGFASFISVDTYAVDPWKVEGIEANKLDNGSVKLTAKVSGNNAGLQYKFLWMRGNWNPGNCGVIKDFDNNDTAYWEPKEAGDYTLCLYVKKKDSQGKSVEKTLDYKVVWKLEGIEIDELDDGFIKLTAKVSGNKKGLKYRFMYYNDGEMKNIAEGEKDSVVWKPEKNKKYTLHLWVADDNNEEHKDLNYPMMIYRGINNRNGNDCPVISAIQLLYNNEDFRSSVLDLKNIDKSKQPYLYELHEQFINIRKNNKSDNGIGVKLAFTDAQLEKIKFDENGDNFSDKSCAEKRILECCYNECEEEPLKTMVSSMKDSFCFSNYVYGLKAAIAENFSEKNLKIGILSAKGFNYEDHNVLDVVGLRFELTGILIHTGSHFYAIVKDPYTKEWYKLDDSSVSKISIEDIQKKVCGAGEHACQFTYSKLK